MINDLRNIKLFASIPEEELVHLAEIIEVRRFKKRDLIFMEGEPAQGIFYIKQGAVQMTKTSYEGKQTILQIFGPGDVLAEAVLFAEAPYPATAEVLEDLTTYFMGSAQMQDLMLKHPRIALYIIKILSARLRTAQDKLKAWAFAGAESRVAKLLIDLAKSHGKETPPGILVDVELPHARLAALSGLTRETVSRVLGSWRAQGLVDTSSKKIIIKNIEEIQGYNKE